MDPQSHVTKRGYLSSGSRPTLPRFLPRASCVVRETSGSLSKPVHSRMSLEPITHHTYENDGRYFSPKPQHVGVPNMKDSGRLRANTGTTAQSDTNPTTLPKTPSGVGPGMTGIGKDRGEGEAGPEERRGRETLQAGRSACHGAPRMTEKPSRQAARENCSIIKIVHHRHPVRQVQLFLR